MMFDKIIMPNKKTNKNKHNTGLKSIFSIAALFFLMVIQPVYSEDSSGYLVIRNNTDIPITIIINRTRDGKVTRSYNQYLQSHASLKILWNDGENRVTSFQSSFKDGNIDKNGPAGVKVNYRTGGFADRLGFDGYLIDHVGSQDYIKSSGCNKHAEKPYNVCTVNLDMAEEKTVGMP